MALSLQALSRVNKRAIAAAGPRYSPGLDQRAPNLEIAYLEAALEALALAGGAIDRIGKAAEELAGTVKRSRDFEARAFGRRLRPSDVTALVPLLKATNDPGEIRRVVMLMRRKAAAVKSTLDSRGQSLASQQRAHGSNTPADKEERSRLDSEFDELNRVVDALDGLTSNISGPEGSFLAGKNCLLLLGSWGTGKTHFLCDVAARSATLRKPALLVLASSLRDGIDPLDAIASQTRLAPDGAALIKDLNEMGRQAKSRALLLVDAINEGDREAWRANLSKIVSAVKRYPNLALVLSCRHPFETTTVPDPVRRRFVELEHVGFEGVEFDAQLEYFAFYGIPAPHVPLIAPEFSRPLFLKLLCGALAGLSKRSQRRNLHDIASGQKGMTYVLEHFVKEVGKSLEDDLSLSRGSCWKALKADGLGLASVMARVGRDWLPRYEALQNLQRSLSLGPADAGAALKRFITDGLLVEDVHWGDETPEEVVKFAYQRFGDHLIARHLLKNHLDDSSEAALRRSFYSNRPIGKVFTLDRWGREFASPGVASAIMLELPERLKRTSRLSEAVFLLPRSRRLAEPIKDAFLEGLYWRASGSFSASTDSIVGFFLANAGDEARDETLEVLLGLATRPGHPYSATRLWGYLAGLGMAERDLLWSEFLRVADESATVYRILSWAERQTSRRPTLEETANDLSVLALLLTTTKRPMRDRATRALVLRGEDRPDQIFDLAIGALAFNDPYVAERVLAAAYGVSMRLWADPKGDVLRLAIVPFARRLVREMFLPDAPHATKHVLSRGYALGIIELAERIQPRCIATRHRRFLMPPLAHIPSPFKSPRGIPLKSVEVAKRGMHMDFENYTVGRLFPDRGNYDTSFPGYQQVLRQIAKRMSDLGFDSRFEKVDRIIQDYEFRSRSRDSDKSDRYGKKYSWIAYFEMYGERLDLGALQEDDWDGRTSDCDIDPSFPPSPSAQAFKLPPMFHRAPRPLARWLRDGPVPDLEPMLTLDEMPDGSAGPWVLLDASISQEGSFDRKYFARVDTLLMPTKDVPDLVERAAADAWIPGHGSVPEPLDDYYTYAGEVPWSRHFGPSLRRTSGLARRHTDWAFRRYSRNWGGAPVEIPVHRWAWESYHSTMNQVEAAMFVAPSICESLGLVNHRDSLDLFDSRGERATAYVRARPGNPYFPLQWLYIREDLLDAYLRETRQQLVWVQWGERELSYTVLERRSLPADVEAALHADAGAFGSVTVRPGGRA